MQCSAPAVDVNWAARGYVVDVDSLYAHLARLRDKRHARGIRHALVTVLVYIILAKLERFSFEFTVRRNRSVRTKQRLRPASRLAVHPARRSSRPPRYAPWPYAA